MALQQNATLALDLSGETGARTPLSLVAYLLVPDICVAFLVATYPTKPLRFLALGAFAYVTARALLGHTVGQRYHDYSTGCTLFGQWLMAVLLLWLSDPLREYRHETDKVLPEQLSLWRRMYWAICLNHSPRGIGWNKQVANCPLPPTADRWTFVRQRMAYNLRYLLLLDACQAFIHTSSLFDGVGDDAVPIMSQGYILGCVGIICWGYTAYGMMNLQYNLVAIAMVVSGYNSPRSWPYLFGSWSDAYSVRRFWGRTWHQLLRKNVTAFGKYATSMLGIKPHTKASSYTQLYVAFFVSGALHVGGDAMVGAEHIGRSMPFFLAQAVAITFEDAIIGLARRLGCTQTTILSRLIGYAWVCLWFSVSIPWYVDWATKAGIAKSEILPFSIVRGVLIPYLETYTQSK